MSGAGRFAPAKVRGLIFDLDGTLIDSQRDLIASVNAALVAVGRPQLDGERITGFVGSGARHLIDSSLGTGADEPVREQALSFFLSHYEEHKLDHTAAYPGVAETLSALSDFPMAVLTNKPVRVSRGILEALGLLRHFRAVYGGNSFASKKPDPHGAKVILREFGLAADEVLLVGDSDVDIRTARNAGAWAAAVEYGFGAHDPGACPADAYLESFPELLAVLGAR